jgi:23S rRNA (guanosine2251-2'-O)-methyltransferase
VRIARERSFAILPKEGTDVPIAYGVHAVSESLKARRVSRLWHERGAGPRVDLIVSRAHELRIPIETLDRRALDKVTRGGVHQGVAAELQPLPAYTIEELVAETDGPPLLVVLDGVEDPQNFGAILRSVDAAGATGLVRQARHSAPLDGATAKASAGAVHHVRIATVVNIARTLEELKDLGVWTVGFDAEATEAYDEVDFTQPTALVLGAEGTGLRRLVREKCERLVSVPMAGQVASLNVSVTAGIGLFEAARQRRAAGSGPQGGRPRAGGTD